MNPYLDSHHNPRLQIRVKLPRWVDLDCMIDTGFYLHLNLKRFVVKLE